MVKVFRHGAYRNVRNPVTLEWQQIVGVQFVEEGRNGANVELAKSTRALSAIVNAGEMGLHQIRTHTEPVNVEKLGEVPVGKEFPELFINREMYSTPQMPQQDGVPARMIGGKPTYFTTFLDTQAKEDEDRRMTNESLIQVMPEIFRNARVGGTVVSPAREEVPAGGGGVNSVLDSALGMQQS